MTADQARALIAERFSGAQVEGSQPITASVAPDQWVALAQFANDELRCRYFAFLTAVDITTGRVAWQDRSFARAQLLHADNKLVILDEDGNLGLATVSPTGVQVLAKASILDHLAWTPPSLSGTRLFVRDRKTMAAYELGK